MAGKDPQRVLLALIVVIVLADVGMGLVIPLWALRGRELGLSAAMIGVLVSMVGAGRLGASLLGGLASDRWGRRPVLVAGITCLAGAALGGGLVPIAGLLFPLRFVEGVGWELMASAGITAVVDLVRRQPRQGALTAKYQAARRGAQAISPALGGLLAAAVGISRVFVAYAGLAVAAALLALWILPRLPAAGTEQRTALRDLRLLGTDRSFAAIATLGLLLTGADLTFQQQLVPTLGHDQGLSTTEIGTVLAAYGLLLAATSLTVGGRAIDRYGARRPLIAGVTVAATGYALVTVLHGFPGLVAALAIAGLGRGLMGAAPTLLLLRLFPQRQGRVQGSYRTANGAGRLLTPAALGSVAASALGPAVWGLAAALVAAAAAVVVLRRGREGGCGTNDPGDPPGHRLRRPGERRRRT
ncbi:MAG: MFS transporter [Streptosporangiaceae bacterium]